MIQLAVNITIIEWSDLTIIRYAYDNDLPVIWNRRTNRLDRGAMSNIITKYIVNGGE